MIEMVLPDQATIRTPFKKSGFTRPNKTVRKAQNHCPDWKVHPNILKREGANRDE